MHQSILEKWDQKKTFIWNVKGLPVLASSPLFSYYSKAELYKRAFQVLHWLSTYAKDTLDIRGPIALYFLYFKGTVQYTQDISIFDI